MTVLPSPIPHPLDYSPFDVPDWAYEALEWVVGFDWPAGNEATTWDVADRWYALAVSLAEPRDEAFAAASQILSGYGGAGITADGFRTAWQQLSGDENAPLNALLQIAHELGELVEECGRDLEAAKLEAWIEIGLFLIELIGMSVAVALTLGAATPAAGGLIMATRLAIQQIFRRLVEQLGRKALKQTAQRAIKDLTTRQGLHRLGRAALREGADEMGEEALTNASIQAYQQTTARADGFDVRDLGMSAAGGFAGGVASRGADIGSHGHGGVARGAGGEVLAEFGAAAVHGELPDLGSAAKAATSGAAGSAIHGLPSNVDLGALDAPTAALPSLAEPAPSSSSASPGPPFRAYDSPAGTTLTSPLPPYDPAATAAPTSALPPYDAAAVASPTSALPPNDAAAVASPTSALPPNDPPATAPPTLLYDSVVTATSFSPNDSSATASLLPPHDAPATASFDSPFSDPPTPAASVTAASFTDSPTPNGSFSAVPDHGTPAVPDADSSASPDAVSTAPPDRTAAVPPEINSPVPPQAALATTDFLGGAEQPASFLGGADQPASPTTTATSGYPTETAPPQAGSTSDTVGSGASWSSSPTLAATAQAVAPTLDAPPTATAPGPANAAPATAFGGSSTPPGPANAAPGLAGTVTVPSSGLAGPANVPAPPAAEPPAPDRTARRVAQSDLDRIATALAPRPVPSSPLPDLSVLNPAAPTTTPPADRPETTRRIATPPPTAPPVSTAPLRTEVDRQPPPAGPRPRAGIVRDEVGYFGYADHARRTHELNRREEYVAYLAGIAEDSRAKILDLGRQADGAFRVGSTLRGADHRRRAAELSAVVAEIETQIDMVRSGELAPATVEVDPHDWTRINTDVGNLAPGGIHTDDRSSLTGTRGHPPIDRTRRYNTYGGLRPPLAVHQLDLENAVPRDGDGRAARLPDPRVGSWFGLANDGGPEADATRGLNCVDGVLALYDTYLHARPRVSAPRTFDAYADGNPDRPLGGEWDGVRRIEEATGSTFQNLCPYVGGAHPAQAKPPMDTALRNLTNHLHNSGHGAFAFILTDLESGGCHSWAAVNQNGTILFLDPQVRQISEDVSLYRHHGVPTMANIVSMDALVVTAEGRPAPLPYHGPGQWSSPPARPTGVNESSTARDERLAVESLQPEHRLFLERSVLEANAVAAAVSDDLHRILAELPDGGNESGRPRIIDEDKRVKSLGSVARKFLSRFVARAESPDAVLGRLKDRVRFSVEVPEDTYGSSVRRIIEGLGELGYHSVEMESFWSGNGRHNGLNVNLRTEAGFILEIQFPTPLSADVGHETHVSYENVRRDNLPIEVRVEAFLNILKINKDRAIHEHLPQGLEVLQDLMPQTPTDTTLAGWLQAKPRRLAAYREYLASSDESFEQILHANGLDQDDVPGTAELGLTGDTSKLRLRTGDDG